MTKRVAVLRKRRAESARLKANRAGGGTLSPAPFNSTAAVIHAAIAGRGIALVRKALVQQELESGRLVHLLPELRWPVEWAYYIVASAKALRRSEVAAFHAWLTAQNALANRQSGDL